MSDGRTFYSFHGELLSKNMARTARRQLDGRNLLFGEYLQTSDSPLSPKRPDEDAPSI